MTKKFFSEFILRVVVGIKLGPINLLRYIKHRLFIKIGFHAIFPIRHIEISGDFFAQDSLRNEHASGSISCTYNYFGTFFIPLNTETPDWFFRLTTLSSCPAPQNHWWQSEKLETELEDIKEIWEISRFGWVLPLAQRASIGKEEDLFRLNSWIKDWLSKNPMYIGYNWRCGQEASIRVMHLAMAALILKQLRNPINGLCLLVRGHLRRIERTFGYALAQDNTHSISESAGLYIGGSWLYSVEGDDESHAWMKLGYRNLCSVLSRLVADSGGFSMYSVAYHREFLDVMNMVEVTRRALDLPAFPAQILKRLGASSEWLRNCVHPETGDAPNIGPNDGSMLLPLADSCYRDFRPTVQLSSVLFRGEAAYTKDGLWDAALDWLQITKPNKALPKLESWVDRDCGFAFLRVSGCDAQVFLRFPKYKFRPGHADPLHIDFWLNGVNILRGPGTYSYSLNKKINRKLSSARSHNTVTFDNKEIMPAIGKFLRSGWLMTSEIDHLSSDEMGVNFGVGYGCSNTVHHYRSASLSNGRLIIRDRIREFEKSAVLRWRLIPSDWSIDCTGDKVCTFYSEERNITIKISADVSIVRCELIQDWESRHYLELTAVPVIEIEIQQNAILTTEVLCAA